MLKNYVHTITLIFLAILITGCAAAESTATPASPVSPTGTLAPPTNTPPPTATPLPPTVTPHPTDTPVTEASPTFTPTSLPPLTDSGGGAIAFTSKQDGNMDIYIVNSDGSNLQRLTNNSGEDYWPTWSPDGAQIAFASQRDGDFEIYTMNADGTNLSRLTHEDGNDLEPAWSPDSGKIAFMVYRDGKSDVYVMNADGSDRQQLTDSEGDNCLPKWSPDGAMIVFVSARDGNPEIYTMNADGSDQVRLTDNPSNDLYPSWSPDGAQIAFSSERDGKNELFVMDVNGDNLYPLTDIDATVWVSDWSPDGSRIAFTSNRDGNREIYILELASGNLERLTDNHILDGIPAWQPRLTNNTQTRSSDGMVMVAVPGGTFQMGSALDEVDAAIDLCREHYNTCNRWYYMRENPQHSVSLDGFWLDQTEVTNAQYRHCVENGICEEPATCKKGEPTYTDAQKSDHPVVCVSWQDVQDYCAWADARLPTEAEWEYAFRGEARAIYPWGDDFDGSRLNYCDANCEASHSDDRFDDGYPRTAPVGSFPQGASWSGALGMSGNVSEWVADWLGDYSPEAKTNPAGPLEGSEKLIKGCSWFSHPTYCRGALRASVSPDTRFDYLGFRCAVPFNQETQGEDGMALDSIFVPSGNPPTLDGTLSPGEWDDAAVETFADGSQLLMMQYDDYLYIGIRVSEPEMVSVNVHIQQYDEIAILHSSAALGTAIYQKGDETWEQIQNFTWRCRNTGNSKTAQAERAEFLQEEGWLASNGRMGTPNEVEYKIKIPEEDFRLAVVFIRSSPPYEKVPWPAGLEDDCILPTPGGLPPEMQFSPEKWTLIKIAN